MLGAVPVAPGLPRLTGRVVDEAWLLTEEQAEALTKRLAEVERKTHHQFVVVTVCSLGGESIESFGIRLLNGWGIGRRFYNDGVALLVAPTEGKVRIEVGFGLENTLTDAEAVMTLYRDVLPRFRRGDMAGGIDAGVISIIREIS